MIMVYDHGIWSWYMIMVYDHGILSWYMFMVYFHGIWSWYMVMVYGHGIWSLYMVMCRCVRVIKSNQRLKEEAIGCFRTILYIGSSWQELRSFECMVYGT